MKNFIFVLLVVVLSGCSDGAKSNRTIEHLCNGVVVVEDTCICMPVETDGIASFDARMVMDDYEIRLYLPNSESRCMVAMRYKDEGAYVRRLGRVTKFHAEFFDFVGKREGMLLYRLRYELIADGTIDEIESMEISYGDERNSTTFSGQEIVKYFDVLVARIKNK